jgi:hypothetical protein
MEDVLEVYQRPYDPKCPVVCMDEKPCQLLGEARESIPMKPDSPKRKDSEYARCDTCSISIFMGPLAGRRHQEAMERRTRVDWTHQIDSLLTIHYYPDAEKIIWASDTLNTHTISFLYETFPPEEASRLAKK